MLKYILIFLLVGGSVNWQEALSQCPSFSGTDLIRLTRKKSAARADYMRKKNAQLLLNREKCNNKTYVACKNHISDQEWHWQEIITMNSCDKIITYSTSDEQHFAELKARLLAKSEVVGSRTYDGLDFEIHQNRRYIIELNEHPNEEGLMFYMMNVIRVRDSNSQ